MTKKKQKKKKPGFGEMASDQVRPSISIKGLLSDDEEEEDGAGDNKANDDKGSIEGKGNAAPTKPKLHKSTKSESHKTTPVEPKETEPETEPEKEPMERHDFYFSESLSDEILDFMRGRRPREKNKSRMMRVILLDFFDKTPEQQTKIYTNGLKKFKGKI